MHELSPDVLRTWWPLMPRSALAKRPGVSKGKKLALSFDLIFIACSVARSEKLPDQMKCEETDKAGHKDQGRRVRFQ